LSEAVVCKKTAEANATVKQEDNKDSTKRKYPDASLGSSLLSPDQKRQSTDYEEIQQQAGLPSDLNKLNKDQILSELNGRNTSHNLSMKSLKKDLIDGLKHALSEEYRKNRMVTKSPYSKEFLAEPEEDSEPIDEEAEDDETVADGSNDSSFSGHSSPIRTTSQSVVSQSTPPPIPTATSSTKTPMRKGSLMNEIRELVNREISATNVTLATVSAQEDEKRKSFIESEFQARQTRHRSSIAAKMAGGGIDSSMATSMDQASGPSVSVDSQSVDEASDMVMSPVKITKSSSMDMADKPKAHVSQHIKVETTVAPALSLVPVSHSRAPECSTADSTWMEVASPTKPSPVKQQHNWYLLFGRMA
jgi:hypothetical protein